MRTFRLLPCLAATLVALIPASTHAQTIAGALQPYIENQTLAGAVTLVATPEKVLAIETVGLADISGKKPMREDTIFWIASMSKPMAATALMMLVDEGKVKIEDPVEKYLPEFKGQWLIAEKDGDHVLLRKPAHPITVHNILTHTSGLPFSTPIEKPTLDLLPLATAVRSYAMAPLEFAPDSKYSYANAGINTAGRIVEVASGMRYEKFLETRLFAPLGMKDTTFRPSSAQVARLAKSYRSNKETHALEEIEITQLHYPLDDPNRQPMPAGGLFSTARDVGRFCQMVLAGGTFEGRRYLSAAAVQQMTTVQTWDLTTSYGFGWTVLKRAAEDGRSAGTFGHGGAYKTAMWVDPNRKLAMVLLRHHDGAFAIPEGNRIEAVFLKAVTDRYSPSH